MIHTPSGGLVPVSALATPVRANGQAELLRENLRQMAEVSGHLEGRDMGSAIAEIRTKLAGLKLPVGYTVEIGGQYASQQQAFRELLMVFGIATVLVFTILVIQFRAWLPAVLILLAAPLSLGGAFLLLWITGTDLNVSSAMGIILLIGLVVKNGIMLLDFSEQLHEQGEPFDAAIAHAGRIRLRPILMTTFCTLFGLLPLALGTRRRSGTAEAAGARRHRRARPVDAGHAAGNPRALRRSQDAERRGQENSRVGAHTVRRGAVATVAWLAAFRAGRARAPVTEPVTPAVDGVRGRAH